MRVREKKILALAASEEKKRGENHVYRVGRWQSGIRGEGVNLVDSEKRKSAQDHLPPGLNNLRRDVLRAKKPINWASPD